MKPQSLHSMLPYLILCVVMVLLGCHKQNMDLDEVWVYGLSNHPCNGSYRMTVENGHTYLPANKPFMDFVAVPQGHQFDYRNVWANQALDAHPPLYYSLLHTLCSLFPGKFNKWLGLSINIFFVSLTLLLIRLLTRALVTDKKQEMMVAIVATAFIASAPLLNSFLYIRMYVAAMFFLTWISYWFVSRTNKEKLLLKDWIVLSIPSVLGTLTHYHVTLFLALCCIVFSAHCAINKRWKYVWQLSATMAISAIIVIAVFPPILHQITGFGNYSSSSLRDTLPWGIRIVAFYRFLNRDIFGYLLQFLIIPLAFFPKAWKSTWMLSIPTALFLLVIAKTSLFVAPRFLYPIYAITLCFFIIIIWNTCSRLTERGNTALIIIILLLILINGHRCCRWDYLRKGGHCLMAENADCLYIRSQADTELSHEIFQEINLCRSLTFVPCNQLELLDTMDFNRENLIIYVENNWRYSPANADSVFHRLRLTTTEPLATNSSFATAYKFIE